MGGVGHPPLRFWYTPPPVCVPFCSTPAVTPIVTPEGSRQRGSIRSPPRGWSAGRWATSKSDRWPRAPSSWRVRPRGAGSSAGTDRARRAAGINGDQRAGRGAHGPGYVLAVTRSIYVSAARVRNADRVVPVIRVAKNAQTPRSRYKTGTVTLVVLSTRNNKRTPLLASETGLVVS